MKKTKCMGTSKNKRAMSGGRGKIGKYTQKFKRSYKRFVKIGDTGDDESRFKKMDEWGRMRNIYNFLKIQNDKYKGSAGTETTAWEKMNDNDDYKSAISCFEQYDNRILSKGECIPEEDYMKGDTSGTPTVIAEASNNDTPVADEALAPEVSDADAPVTPAPEVSSTSESSTSESSTSEVSEVSGETEATPKDPYASNDADNTENAAGETEANPEVYSASDVSDDAPVGDAEAMKADETPATVADAASDTVVQPKADAEAAADEAPAPAPATDAVGQPGTDEAPATDADGQPGTDEAPAPATDDDAEADQGGGRSKRKPRSSRRRRGKSMKSKKGRKTRRKHRAGRH